MRLFSVFTFLGSVSLVFALALSTPSMARASDYVWEDDAVSTIVGNSKRQGIDVEQFYKAIIEVIRPAPTKLCTETPSVDRFESALGALSNFRDHSSALRELFKRQRIDYPAAIREVIIEYYCPRAPVCP
jgi:hypothetical protein